MRSPVVVFIVQSVRSSSALFRSRLHTLPYKLTFSVFRVPTFISRNICRQCRLKMKSIPLCPPSVELCGGVVGNPSIHFLRSPPLPVVRHRRWDFSSITVGRIFLFRSTDDLFFNFGAFTQYCMGTSSYWPKTPGRRNRLTLLVSLSMT